MFVDFCKCVHIFISGNLFQLGYVKFEGLVIIWQVIILVGSKLELV